LEASARARGKDAQPIDRALRRPLSVITDFPNRGSGNCLLLARRDDDGHKFQSRSFPQCDLFSVPYLDILKLDRADLDEVLPANISKSAAAMTA